MNHLRIVKPAPHGFSDLYKSQQAGITVLFEHNAVLFVAPLGYGKTVTCMTAIGELIELGEVRKAIVVAPKRVAEIVWPEERDQWAHLQHLSVVPVTGTPTVRKAKLMADADIYVIGIDNIPWLCAVLTELDDGHPLLDLICVDEISRLKNPRGVWYKAMRKVAPRFRNRWGLTGTPRPNGYLDMFGPLSFLSANKLWGRSFDTWRRRHFYPTDYMQHDWKVLPGQEAALEADIATMTVTVDNSDMPDLPPVVVRDRWVELPFVARHLYDEMEKKLVADEVVAANAAVATIKLAQIGQGFLYDEDRSVKEIHHAKMEELFEMVEALDGDPVIVVYEFQEDLDRLRSCWPDLRWLGSGVTPGEAAQNVIDWNSGRVPIMALHPAAAGHGLNLQKGGHQMIFYGMTWSAELYEQVIGRLQRQGQSEHVFVHRILARNTVDEAKVIKVESKCSDQEAFRQYLKRRVK
jgi:hypothetical protein